MWSGGEFHTWFLSKYVLSTSSVTAKTTKTTSTKTDAPWTTNRSGHVLQAWKEKKPRETSEVVKAKSTGKSLGRRERELLPQYFFLPLLPPPPTPLLLALLQPLIGHIPSCGCSALYHKALLLSVSSCTQDAQAMLCCD